MACHHDDQSDSPIPYQSFAQLRNINQIMYFQFCDVDGWRNFKFATSEHLVRVHFVGLFYQKIVVERVDELKVDVCLVRYEIFTHLDGQLLHGLEIVTLLVGEQSGYYRRICPRYLVNYVNRDLQSQ